MISKSLKMLNKKRCWQTHKIIPTKWKQILE